MGFQMCPIPSKRKEHHILPWHYFADVLLVEVLLLCPSRSIAGLVAEMAARVS